MGHDLLIKNGTVIDGSGGPRYQGDIGIQGGRIAEIGRIRTAADQVIDADGRIVAPGFIDGHTHMDAQVAWDPLGSCSCWHGVTSVVMGNCGFALAPCRPDQREWIARCLEAVEDIPTEAMMAGVNWTWETFPEYLDTVAKLPKASMGEGVWLIESKADWQRYCERTNVLYAQEYLPIDRDVRVVIVGDRVVSAYWRTQADQGFYNNVSQGGRIDRGPVPTVVTDLQPPRVPGEPVRVRGWRCPWLDDVPGAGSR